MHRLQDDRGGWWRPRIGCFNLWSITKAHQVLIECTDGVRFRWLADYRKEGLVFLGAADYISTAQTRDFWFQSHIKTRGEIYGCFGQLCGCGRGFDHLHEHNISRRAARNNNGKGYDESWTGCTGAHTRGTRLHATILMESGVQMGIGGRMNYNLKLNW